MEWHNNYTVFIIAVNAAPVPFGKLRALPVETSSKWEKNINDPDNNLVKRFSGLLDENYSLFGTPGRFPCSGKGM